VGHEVAEYAVEVDVEQQHQAQVTAEHEQIEVLLADPFNRHPVRSVVHPCFYWEHRAGFHNNLLFDHIQNQLY